MSKQVPFDAYIKIFPQRTGKRHEYIREIQRISSLIYDALTDAALYTDKSSAMNIAEPGGGQQLYNRNTGNKYSSLSYGGGVVPQFGNSPPYVQITGFYTSTAANTQVHPNTTLIHAGETLTRAGGAHSFESNPNTAFADEVKTLKALIESNLTTGLPGGITYDVYRICYAGVIWGNRGYHFPA
tara:strand:- start:1627 stop:2178 length:552 start_codon:yes stop_codon:yes gene_type:complete